MNSKYHVVEVKPNIDTLGNVAFAADDVLFDWTPFEIPRGTAALQGLNFIVAGTNAAAQSSTSELDIDLYFAKSVNGVAPPTMGITNAVTTVIKSAAFRPHLISYLTIDANTVDDGGAGLVGYNVFEPQTIQPSLTLLEGDLNYTSTTGYQTIWVAGIAQGAADFGTGVIVNAAHAVDDLAIATDGIDPDDVFAVGDVLRAFDADGSDATALGTVTAVAANLVTVDADHSQVLADDDEICFRNPITIRLGFEY